MKPDDSPRGRVPPLIPVLRFRRDRRQSTGTRTVTKTVTEVARPDEDTAVDESPLFGSDLVDLIPAEADRDSRFDPEHIALLLKGRKAGQAFAGIRSEEADELARFAHFLFELERFDAARLVLEGLVSAGVDQAFPHTLLGTVYLAQGDAERALALFEAALTLDEDDVAARVYRGEVRWRQGKLGSATEDLRAAISKGKPDDPFTLRAEKLLRRVKSGNA